MPIATDERGVSESAGLAVLIATTVLVTASVGLSVFVGVGDETGVQANFSFEYNGDGSSLLVSHSGGDTLPAGEIVVSGPETNVTWAAVADVNETAPVSEGDLILLSQNSAYGTRVGAEDTVRMVHVPDEGNRTVLSAWRGAN